jgi:hypothetical protein
MWPFGVMALSWNSPASPGTPVPFPRYCPLMNRMNVYSWAVLVLKYATLVLKYATVSALAKSSVISRGKVSVQPWWHLRNPAAGRQHKENTRFHWRWFAVNGKIYRVTMHASADRQGQCDEDACASRSQCRRDRGTNHRLGGKEER